MTGTAQSLPWSRPTAWLLTSSRCCNVASSFTRILPVSLRTRPTLTLFPQVAAGSRHSAALAESGQAYTWGGNKFGALGNGTTTTSCVPMRVGGLPERVCDVAAAGWHTLFICEVA